MITKRKTIKIIRDKPFFSLLIISTLQTNIKQILGEGILEKKKQLKNGLRFQKNFQKTKIPSNSRFKGTNYFDK